MTNRAKIVNFCNGRGLKIGDLTFLGASYWQLEVSIDPRLQYQTYDTSLGDTVDEGIELMFKDIEDDLNNIQLLIHR
jgi:hypothetical protein